jgi:hypothetical protein
MFSENELKNIAKKYSFDIYNILVKDNRKAISFWKKNIDEFWDFVIKNKIDTIFYYYEKCRYEELEIKLLTFYRAGFKIEHFDSLRDEIKIYNEELRRGEFEQISRLWLFCIYKNNLFEASQDNEEFLKSKFAHLEQAVLEMVEKHNSEIREMIEKTIEKRKQVREELKQFLKNDEKFRLCTNAKKRRSYYNYFRKDKRYKRFVDAFIYGRGNWYDIPLNDFIEGVWCELKEEMKSQK